MDLLRLRIRLHGDLETLRPPRDRGCWIEARCAPHATIKHTIEALGVPHTEVGSVRVDGEPATLDRTVTDGASIEVAPAAHLDGPARFIADAHLGGLARRLRLFGFDCLFAGGIDDAELARLAEEEHRVVLSRDRELLKHRRIARGRFVRATRTDAQAGEVLDAFALRDRMRPLTRCLECNGVLRPASADEVAGRVPPGVAASQAEFVRCEGCGRIYWPGTHLRRLRGLVDAARA